MKILICSDGMPAADNATRIGGFLAAACRAETTLLGIAEKPRDDHPLRDALHAQAELLRADGVVPEIVVRAGEPIREMLQQTSTINYDLVVIGSQRTATSGLYWRSQKTYEVIKAIPPPVLVAVGDCTKLKRFLVCTGGKAFIDDAVQLTGKVAAAVGASVTLLHVMAEPPAIYADLVHLEEDVDRLLDSGSELGQNLVRQKKQLEALGVHTQVRVRHGIVIDEVFAEVREGDHDLIVTGSSQARGALRHYIMGDLTRSILNRADCPVLVARGKAAPVRNFGTRSKICFANRLDRQLAAHQRLADENGIDVARFYSRDVFHVFDSTLAHQQHIIRHAFAQFLGDGKIDIERGEIAIVDPDDLCAGLKRAFQFFKRVHFHQRIEPILRRGARKIDKLLLLKRCNNE